MPACPSSSAATVPDHGGVLHVTGARPNFPKAAPVIAALAERGVEQFLVHTGQHYDDKLSRVFFDELGLPDRTSTWASARAVTRCRPPP